MARKSGNVRRDGRMRRNTEWIEAPVDSTTLASASTAVLTGVLSAGSLLLRPFTIVRTRGMFYARSDQTAALEDWSVALGYAVVSEQATAIGVTAVPTPETDKGSDLWFVYEEIFGTFGFISGVGVFMGDYSRSFDSKAMRKVEDGQDLSIVVETSAISAGVKVVESARILVKLH